VLHLHDLKQEWEVISWQWSGSGPGGGFRWRRNVSRSGRGFMAATTGKDQHTLIKLLSAL